MDAQGRSLEDRARRARYRFFEEVRRRFSADKIALGHQRNDQAETVLMRLLRGSGTGGLSGIAPIRDGRVIRPILELGRPEIETYLRERELSFKTDPTNREGKFLRNRIRSLMIPSLEQYQPQVIDILAQTADILREDHAYLEAVSREWLAERAPAQRNSPVEIDVAELLELPPALGKRVIRHCVDHMGTGLAGVAWRHINAVYQLAGGKRSQGTIRLPKGLVVQRTYGRLSFGKDISRKSADYFHILHGPGRYVVEDASCTLLVEEMRAMPPSFREGAPWTAYFDARKISYPLALRNFRPGDRFVPLGMHGHKKVKDLFIDRKLPKLVRSRLPILLSGENILWVCGMMIDDRVKVSLETEKVLKVSLRRVSDSAGLA
jgi:tRNA(Ile)-lysidine synthase